MKRTTILPALSVIVCWICISCAGLGRNLKTLVGGSPGPEDGMVDESASVPRFSYNDHLGAPIKRNYGAMTRERFEKEAQVDDRSGSLWMSEGQSAHLFAQNMMRLVGDLLNVRLVGSARQQIDTKVSVIEKLVQTLEEEKEKQAQAKLAQRGPSAQVAGESQEATGTAGDTAGANAPPGANSREPATAGGSSASRNADSKSTVKLVPTRIVERLNDGNYRIKGVQSFMIGAREFKVLVTGIVRAEDFNDGGINSSQLLDAKFDVVGVRKANVL